MSQEKRLEAVEVQVAELRRENDELKRRDREQEAKKRPAEPVPRIRYRRLTGGFC